jgi:hypothetical protein
MYEWKTLRTIAVVLIALPLLHLLYAVSKGAANYLEPGPEVWADSLQRIIDSDMQATLPDRPVLVVGGQRVRLWRELPDRLAPRATLLRPLGDATIDDIAFYYDRLIGHYRPDTLVIVPGYAELHLRDSKSPEAFVESARRLLRLDTDYGVTRRRVLLAPILMPLHPEDNHRIEAMAAGTKALEQELPDLLVLDPNTILTRADGRPNPDYYLSDGINLNNEGYARVTLMLEQALGVASTPRGGD